MKIMCTNRWLICVIVPLLFCICYGNSVAAYSCSSTVQTICKRAVTRQPRFGTILSLSSTKCERYVLAWRNRSAEL